MNPYYIKIKQIGCGSSGDNVLTIHRSNIHRLVMVNGIAHIQLGNMDNIKGVLL